VSKMLCESLRSADGVSCLRPYLDSIDTFSTFISPSLPPPKLAGTPLFRVRPFWKFFLLRNIKSTHCYGCQIAFPPLKKPPKSTNNIINEAAQGTQRFACPSCHNHFCIDCDLFCHETLHNCPGCERLSQDSNGKQNGEPNGEVSMDTDPMIID